jgi:DNA-binding response OmpR family regulator
MATSKAGIGSSLAAGWGAARKRGRVLPEHCTKALATGYGGFHVRQPADSLPAAGAAVEVASAPDRRLLRMHVLIVEDDSPLAESIATAMRACGWRPDVSPRGEPVPASLLQDAYDVLVLDIGLPGIDGLETLRRVREQGSLLPVLMLTARDAVDDRVLGLECGADDYLVKPFALSELLARLRALVRRHELRRSETLILSTLRFDAGARRAQVDGRPVHLSERECIVLQYLMLKTGRIVAREQLAALVPGWDAGTSDNALELLISRLRNKIEPGGVRLRTVRGLGYLLEPAAPA